MCDPSLQIFVRTEEASLKSSRVAAKLLISLQYYVKMKRRHTVTGLDKSSVPSENILVNSTVELLKIVTLAKNVLAGGNSK